MPRIVVRMKPCGSLSPGCTNMAMMPATKQMMIVQMMCTEDLPAACMHGHPRSRFHAACCGKAAAPEHAAHNCVHNRIITWSTTMAMPALLTQGPKNLSLGERAAYI